MTHFDHNALVFFFIRSIPKGIVPADYPAGEFPASRILGYLLDGIWYKCLMPAISQFKI